MLFSYNESNALYLQFFIINAASIIDIFLVHAILRTVPCAVHVVFIGDVYQLPVVETGNFLRDVINSHSHCMVSRLRRYLDKHTIV